MPKVILPSILNPKNFDGEAIPMVEAVRSMLDWKIPYIETAIQGNFAALDHLGLKGNFDGFDIIEKMIITSISSGGIKCYVGIGKLYALLPTCALDDRSGFLRERSLKEFRLCIAAGFPPGSLEARRSDQPLWVGGLTTPLHHAVAYMAKQIAAEFLATKKPLTKKALRRALMESYGEVPQSVFDFAWKAVRPQKRRLTPPAAA